MRRLAGIAAAVLATAVLVGCQPATPPVTPTPSGPPVSTTAAPTPTYLCTPEAGGEESPCSQVDYEEMKAKEALYAEAEAVYREFFAENIRISRAGGVAEPTDVILATTHGVALDEAMAAFTDLIESGIHARGDDPRLTISRVPGVSRDGSLVTLHTCVDATGWAFYRGNELFSEPGFGEDRVYFSLIDRDLKMTYVEGREVDTCAG